MVAMISSILGIIAMMLEIWMQNRPNAQETRYAEIQTGRKDIAAGNGDAVNARIDRLLTVTNSGNDPSGEQHSEITAGRISAVLGVAAAGRGPGADTGKS
ncbi:MAG: hypothetical protein M0023_04385 [Desulfobacteraceae bacterium]|nr:hypothetical protein [Desulfobacteraceae bacterium]